MFYIMCPPTYFSVDYVINPWMSGNINNVIKNEADQQWTTLYNLISKLSSVHTITPREGLPDMVFTANAGSKICETFFLSNFKSEERKPEEKHFEDWARRGGLKVIHLENNFEGDGDFLFDPSKNIYFMGHGFRTSLNASTEIQDHLSCNIQPLKLIDRRFYHLDTCFCPLENGKALVFMDAFHKDSQKKLTEIYGERNLIKVTEKEAVHFACNSIVINGHLITPCDIRENTLSSIKNNGFIVDYVYLSEFMKAGGAAKCLTLRV